MNKTLLFLLLPGLLISCKPTPPSGDNGEIVPLTSECLLKNSDLYMKYPYKIKVQDSIMCIWDLHGGDRFYLPFFLSLFQHILHFSLLTYTGIPTSSFSYFSFKLSSNLNIFCKRSPQAVTHGEGRKRAIVKKIVESDIFLKLSLTSTVQ